MQIAKVKFKYPRSEQFDAVLLQYINLECELLYNTYKEIDKEYENDVIQRVLRLLRFIFHDALQSNELSLKAAATACDKAILKLITCVRTDFISENRLVSHTVVKLLRKLDLLDKIDKLKGMNVAFQQDTFLSNPLVCSIRQSLTTSDYESDVDDDDDDDMVTLIDDLLVTKRGLFSQKEECTSKNCNNLPLNVDIEENNRLLISSKNVESESTSFSNSTNLESSSATDCLDIQELSNKIIQKNVMGFQGKQDNFLSPDSEKKMETVPETTKKESFVHGSASFVNQHLKVLSTKPNRSSSPEVTTPSNQSVSGAEVFPINGIPMEIEISDLSKNLRNKTGVEVTPIPESFNEMNQSSGAKDFLVNENSEINRFSTIQNFFLGENEHDVRINADEHSNNTNVCMIMTRGTSNSMFKNSNNPTIPSSKLSEVVEIIDDRNESDYIFEELPQSNTQSEVPNLVEVVADTPIVTVVPTLNETLSDSFTTNVDTLSTNSFVTSKEEAVNGSVITIEIHDDDDDDNNYMGFSLSGNESQSQPNVDNPLNSLLYPSEIKVEENEENRSPNFSVPVSDDNNQQFVTSSKNLKNASVTSVDKVENNSNKENVKETDFPAIFISDSEDEVVNDSPEHDENLLNSSDDVLKEINHALSELDAIKNREKGTTLSKTTDECTKTIHNNENEEKNLQEIRNAESIEKQKDNDNEKVKKVTCGVERNTKEVAVDVELIANTNSLNEINVDFRNAYEVPKDNSDNMESPNYRGEEENKAEMDEPYKKIFNIDVAEVTIENETPSVHNLEINETQEIITAEVTNGAKTLGTNQEFTLSETTDECTKTIHNNENEEKNLQEMRNPESNEKQKDDNEKVKKVICGVERSTKEVAVDVELIAKTNSLNEINVDFLNAHGVQKHNPDNMVSSNYRGEEENKAEMEEPYKKIVNIDVAEVTIENETPSLHNLEINETQEIIIAEVTNGPNQEFTRSEMLNNLEENVEIDNEDYFVDNVIENVAYETEVVSVDMKNQTELSFKDDSCEEISEKTVITNNRVQIIDQRQQITIDETETERHHISPSDEKNLSKALNATVIVEPPVQKSTTAVVSEKVVHQIHDCESTVNDILDHITYLGEENKKNVEKIEKYTSQHVELPQKENIMLSALTVQNREDKELSVNLNENLSTVEMSTQSNEQLDNFEQDRLSHQSIIEKNIDFAQSDIENNTSENISDDTIAVSQKEENYCTQNISHHHNEETDETLRSEFRVAVDIPEISISENMYNNNFATDIDQEKNFALEITQEAIEVGQEITCEAIDYHVPIQHVIETNHPQINLNEVKPTVTTYNNQEIAQDLSPNFSSSLVAVTPPELDNQVTPIQTPLSLYTLSSTFAELEYKKGSGDLELLANIAADQEILAVKTDSEKDLLDPISGEESNEKCLQSVPKRKSKLKFQYNKKGVVREVSPRAIKQLQRRPILKQTAINKRSNYKRIIKKMSRKIQTSNSKEVWALQCNTEDSKYKPHDFISAENTIQSPLKNNVYAQKRLIETNTTSEDSNDSCENSLFIDLDDNLKNIEKVTKSTLEESKDNKVDVTSKCQLNNFINILEKKENRNSKRRVSNQRNLKQKVKFMESKCGGSIALKIFEVKDNKGGKSCLESGELEVNTSPAETTNLKSNISCTDLLNFKRMSVEGTGSLSMHCLHETKFIKTTDHSIQNILNKLDSNAEVKVSSYKFLSKVESNKDDFNNELTTPGIAQEVDDREISHQFVEPVVEPEKQGNEVQVLLDNSNIEINEENNEVIFKTKAAMKSYDDKVQLISTCKHLEKDEQDDSLNKNQSCIDSIPIADKSCKCIDVSELNTPDITQESDTIQQSGETQEFDEKNVSVGSKSCIVEQKSNTTQQCSPTQEFEERHLVSVGLGSCTVEQKANDTKTSIIAKKLPIEAVVKEDICKSEVQVCVDSVASRLIGSVLDANKRAKKLKSSSQVADENNEEEYDKNKINVRENTVCMKVLTKQFISEEKKQGELYKASNVSLVLDDCLGDLNLSGQLDYKKGKQEVDQFEKKKSNNLHKPSNHFLDEKKNEKKVINTEIKKSKTDENQNMKKQKLNKEESNFKNETLNVSFESLAKTKHFIHEKDKVKLNKDDTCQVRKDITVLNDCIKDAKVEVAQNDAQNKIRLEREKLENPASVDHLKDSQNKHVLKAEKVAVIKKNDVTLSSGFDTVVSQEKTQSSDSVSFGVEKPTTVLETTENLKEHSDKGNREKNKFSKTADKTKRQTLENTIKKMKEKIEESKKSKKGLDSTQLFKKTESDIFDTFLEKRSLQQLDAMQAKIKCELEKTQAKKINCDSREDLVELNKKKDRKRRRSRSLSKSRNSDKKFDYGTDKEKSFNKSSRSRSSSKSRSLGKKNKNDSEIDGRRRSELKSVEESQKSKKKCISSSIDERAKPDKDSSKRRNSESKEMLKHDHKQTAYKKGSSKSPTSNPKENLSNKKKPFDKEKIRKSKNEEFKVKLDVGKSKTENKATPDDNTKKTITNTDMETVNNHKVEGKVERKSGKMRSHKIRKIQEKSKLEKENKSIDKEIEDQKNKTDNSVKDSESTQKTFQKNKHSNKTKIKEENEENSLDITQSDKHNESLKKIAIKDENKSVRSRSKEKVKLEKSNEKILIKINQGSVQSTKTLKKYPETFKKDDNVRDGRKSVRSHSKEKIRYEKGGSEHKIKSKEKNSETQLLSVHHQKQIHSPKLDITIKNGKGSVGDRSKEKLKLESDTEVNKGKDYQDNKKNDAEKGTERCFQKETKYNKSFEEQDIHSNCTAKERDLSQMGQEIIADAFLNLSNGEVAGGECVVNFSKKRKYEETVSSSENKTKRTNKTVLISGEGCHSDEDHVSVKDTRYVTILEQTPVKETVGFSIQDTSSMLSGEIIGEVDNKHITMHKNVNKKNVQTSSAQPDFVNTSCLSDECSSKKLLIELHDKKDSVKEMCENVNSSVQNVSSVTITKEHNENLSVNEKLESTKHAASCVVASTNEVCLEVNDSRVDTDSKDDGTSHIETSEDKLKTLTTAVITSQDISINNELAPVTMHTKYEEVTKSNGAITFKFTENDKDKKETSVCKDWGKDSRTEQRCTPVIDDNILCSIASTYDNQLRESDSTVDARHQNEVHLKHKVEYSTPPNILLRNDFVPNSSSEPICINVFSSSENVCVQTLSTLKDSTIKKFTAREADLSFIQTSTTSAISDCITTATVSLSDDSSTSLTIKNTTSCSQSAGQSKSCLFTFNADGETVNRENLNASDIFHTSLGLEDISPTKLPLASNQSLDLISPSTSIAEMSNSMNLVQTLGTSGINFDVADTSEIEIQQTNKQNSFGSNFVTRVTEISCYVEKESTSDHNYTLGDPLLGGNNEDKNILTTGLSLSNSPEEFQLNESHLEDLTFNENNFIEENGTLDDLGLLLPCKKEKPDFDNIIDDPIPKPEDIQNSIKRLNMLVEQGTQSKTVPIDNVVDQQPSTDCSGSLGIDYAVSKLLFLGGNEVTSQNNSFSSIPDIDNINIIESTVSSEQQTKHSLENTSVTNRGEANVRTSMRNTYPNFMSAEVNQKVVVEAVEQCSIISVDQLKKDYMNEPPKVDEKVTPDMEKSVNETNINNETTHKSNLFTTFLKSVKRDANKSGVTKVRDVLENCIARKYNRTPLSTSKKKSLHIICPAHKKNEDILSNTDTNSKMQNSSEGRIRVKTDLIKAAESEGSIRNTSLSSLDYIREHDQSMTCEDVLPFDKSSKEQNSDIQQNKLSDVTTVCSEITKHPRSDKMGNDDMENKLNVQNEAIPENLMQNAKLQDKPIKRSDSGEVNRKRKFIQNDNEVKRDEKRLKKSEDGICKSRNISENIKSNTKKSVSPVVNSKLSNDDIFDKLLREGPVNKVFTQRMNEQKTKKEIHYSSVSNINLSKNRGLSTTPDAHRREKNTSQVTSTLFHDSSKYVDCGKIQKRHTNNSNANVDKKFLKGRHVISSIDTASKRYSKSYGNSYSSKSDPCTTRDYKLRDRRMSIEQAKNLLPKSNKSETNRKDDEFSWIDKFSDSGLFNTPSDLFMPPGTKREETSCRK